MKPHRYHWQRMKYLNDSANYSTPKAASSITKVCPRKEIIQAVTHLTAGSATAHECTVKMWTMLKLEVNSYEESIASSQKDDANGVLVFVSPALQNSIVCRIDKPYRQVSSPQSSPSLPPKAIRSYPPTLAIIQRPSSSRYHGSSPITHTPLSRPLSHSPLPKPFSASMHCGFSASCLASVLPFT